MSTAHVQMCNYLTKLSTSKDRPNKEDNDWGPTKSGLKRTHSDYCRILRTDRPRGGGPEFARWEMFMRKEGMRRGTRRRWRRSKPNRRQTRPLPRARATASSRRLVMVERELQEVSVQKHRLRQTRGKDEVDEVERAKPTRQPEDFPRANTSPRYFWRILLEGIGHFRRHNPRASP